ncbi:HTH-type transcriptional regulator, lysR family [Phaeobacter piscinae]|uniref:HTH-type transcriptional regulator, lysR family n=1 Tax=Phaeobacter piscinae TaxID=1580596 RepID=A0ABM6PG64_9RHOB|nr:LysR substrate-binding domain-containing protein [Phaeobacter piscinae]ATG36670.1 HTH-type transcriptional regulator, lysR family [Phaeobacter piscinae]AUQ87191.1 HTH-type transcriptional regulator, lysR family [Phaeobacter piscinae]AUR25074.1 HTH-type transcriptional regulator, lysR family [Phaeobacter piscinae]
MPSAHSRPPLRSLQVFETAARHGSFTAAGEELGITQSGVSRQVSDLEATLGVALFVRKGARLTVTPTGERLAGQLSDALSRTWSAVADARRSDQVVTLSMLPSVAARWFAPRLGTFLAENPGIDLRITASRHLVDFAAEGVDAAIRYSPSPAHDLEALKLGTETVRPVCSPDYQRTLDLNAPDDLYRATLLCGDIPEDWPAWFRAAGCESPPPPGPRLGDDGAILQAAVERQGVALGRSLLVADDIAAGRLIAPFDISLEASHAYWFVQPKGIPPTLAIESVKAWLADQFTARD